MTIYDCLLNKMRRRFFEFIANNDKCVAAYLFDKEAIGRVKLVMFINWRAMDVRDGHGRWRWEE